MTMVFTELKLRIYQIPHDERLMSMAYLKPISQRISKSSNYCETVKWMVAVKNKNCFFDSWMTQRPWAFIQFRCYLCS